MSEGGYNSKKSNLIINEDEKSTRFVSHREDISDILKAALAEGIAELFLVMAIYLASDPESITIAVYVIIMVFGNVSGVHINPAVTLSLWLYNGNIFTRPHVAKLLSYIFAQIVGAFLGALLSKLLGANLTLFEVENEDLEIFFVEYIFTGSLIFIVLLVNSKSTRPTDTNYVNCACVVMWLYFIVKAGAKISNAVYNPALYFVFNIMSFAYHGADFFDKIHLYIIPQFLGGVSFMILFKYMYRPFYIARGKKIIQEAEDDETSANK
jgi:glycerol uptake facilitator-like aquaporin